MSRVLGILNFEPSYVNVQGLGDYRPISAASILGRYRVADFMLSNFTNSGIDVIKVLIKEKPRSLVEHISRTSYNINSKRGDIHILFGEDDFSSNSLYNVDIRAFKTYMHFIEREDPSYIVIAPSHFIYKQDFSLLVEHHKKSKNDITMLYHRTNNADTKYLMGDALTIDKKGRITKFHKNRGKYKSINISLEAYVMDIVTFKNLVEEASNISSLYSLSDIIADKVKELKVGGYKHNGLVDCISTLNAYYVCNMSISKQGRLSKLINDDWPIYTMSTNACPTLYMPNAKVKASLIANGCLIKGTVINSVISRNVVVQEGAVIKDSIILPDTVIGKDVTIEDAIVDRLAIVSHTKTLVGSKDNPLYVKRGDRI